MVCPECGGEYREGFIRCADCDVELVEELPAPPEEDLAAEPVTVLETGDPAALALAESLLQDAGIPFFAKGEYLQDLFALGRFGFGFSSVAGPVALQVAAEHAPAAAQILDATLAEALEDPDPLEDFD